MQERNSRACTAPPRQPLTSAGLRNPPPHVEPKQSPQWGFRLWLPLVSPLPPLQEARGSVVGSASSALGGRYAVLVSCGCCNKSPLTRGFRTSSLWSYSSGGQKSGGGGSCANIKVLAGRSPSGEPGKDCSPTSPAFRVTHIPWLVAPSLTCKEPGDYLGSSQITQDNPSPHLSASWLGTEVHLQPECPFAT